jgi:hypothetical protein
MCAQTPHRRCRSAFARKYLSGDPVKAKCGAPIEVQVIDQATGETVPGSQLKNVQLEVRRTVLPGLLWRARGVRAFIPFRTLRIVQCCLLRGPYQPLSASSASLRPLDVSPGRVLRMPGRSCCGRVYSHKHCART